MITFSEAIKKEEKSIKRPKKFAKKPTLNIFICSLMQGELEEGKEIRALKHTKSINLLIFG